MRSYGIELQHNFESTQRVRRGLFIMSADTEHLRITLLERSSAQLDGSAGLTFALCMQHPRIVGSTREYFEYDFAYELSRMLCRLIFCRYSIGCATALPMGV